MEEVENFELKFGERDEACESHKQKEIISIIAQEYGCVSKPVVTIN